MFGRFRVCMRVLALIALSASILSPQLRAEPATKTPNLTPLDYPLSPSARSKLPPSAAPAATNRNATAGRRTATLEAARTAASAPR
jgi:hypothetical protein